MREPFLSAIPILKKLEDAGYEAYFVGGSVRDYLLHKPINDVDIATSALPEEVKDIFPKTVDIGIEHGTILILFGKKSYEITTFRTEGDYQDYRRPREVSFIRSLPEDLKRRDFTMNAIAMDKTGQLIDPYNGQQAIQNKIIKTVGNPKDRFGEDALRMMRAVRFVSQLSFRITEQTLAALKELAPLLNKIAVERKTAEFEKLLMGENWREALAIMLDANINMFLPGLKDRRQQLEKFSSYQCEDFTKIEMWSLLINSFQLSAKEIEDFLRAWRLPVKEIKEVKSIIASLKKRLHEEWTLYDMYKAGWAVIESVEKLYCEIKGIAAIQKVQQLRIKFDSLPIKNSKEIVVTGNDLMDWFSREPGSWLKEMLSKIEQAILARQVKNDKQKIKEWLMACSQN
ncbi:CCA tRNA nucleotidyltransferase [Bacillus rubiinfantis]|uniref:CCA tRNA nucleotidyltransferase n=1 Tax=Bacillus rubiinfantis TaxID=1499680 RepID=UPI0005A74681|nr:CCA tRNA nucleotidyltransferase [Bacillus rubiinfantis]